MAVNTKSKEVKGSLSRKMVKDVFFDMRRPGRLQQGQEGTMKVLVDSRQMKQCDKNTIEYFGMPSLVLMERAALSVVQEVENHFGKGKGKKHTALVACGFGNNGGDGLAIGRMLWQRGYGVTILMPPGDHKMSEEAKAQKGILEKYGVPMADAIPMQEFDVIIDALFGIGLARDLEGVYRQFVDGMNARPGFKVAVDIPSGIHADTGAVLGVGFRADLTVTFAFAKTGLLLYPGAEYAGKVLVKDIGISSHSFLGEKPTMYCVGEEEYALLPERKPYSNKGTFGKVLAVAGSKNMAGAAFLSGKASYATGAGLVRIFTEEKNRVALQGLLPEAILTTYGGAKDLEGTLEKALSWADAIVAGPGIGIGEAAKKLVKSILKHAKAPVILDADGLNVVASHLKWLKKAKAPVIVTPHLGEMARLSGMGIADIQKQLLQVARNFAQEYHVICVLKDARTITALPDGRAYFNVSGNHGMAAAGAGDVLSGVLAGLAAQGMRLEEAAPVGVYLHGAAADRQLQATGAYGMMAHHLIDGVAQVLKEQEEIRKVEKNEAI